MHEPLPFDWYEIYDNDVNKIRSEHNIRTFLFYQHNTSLTYSMGLVSKSEIGRIPHIIKRMCYKKLCMMRGIG